MDATAWFARLVARPEHEVPLDEAALAIAAHARPGLDVAAATARLDALAAGAPGDFAGLADHLFGRAGFAGDTTDYADPENSYLDAVLERRLGLPITLTLVMIEVGRRAGVVVDGIGMPGHFLAGSTDGSGRYCDPFHGGQVLDAAGCAALYARVSGGQPFSPAYLAPVGRLALLGRMLANLRTTLLDRDPPAAAWAVRLRLVMPDCGGAERAALAAVLVRLGRFLEAAAELERAAGQVGGPDGDRLGREAAAARARAN